MSADSSVRDSLLEIRRLRRRLIPGWAILVAPTVAALVTLVALPLASALVRSFQTFVAPLKVSSRWTFQNYGTVFSNDYYRSAFVRTLELSGITVGLCLIVAYPIAYFIVSLRTRSQAPLLLVFVSPLLVSAVVRSYGIYLLVSPVGPLNELLLRTHIVHQPLQLIGNDTGIVIGLTQVLLAFMLVPLYASLRAIEPALAQTARSLGARPFRAFRAVTVPLSLPGMLAGATLVFTLSVGQFVVPSLLGGSSVPVLAQLAYNENVTYLNWALGSALGIVLIVISLGGVVLTLQAARFVRGDRRASVIAR
jgi:putative spermidine/putrescine transport system permease protein